MVTTLHHSYLCSLSRTVNLTVLRVNIKVRIDRHSGRKVGIEQTENEKRTVQKKKNKITYVHSLLSSLIQLVLSLSAFAPEQSWNCSTDDLFSPLEENNQVNCLPK